MSVRVRNLLTRETFSFFNTPNIFLEVLNSYFLHLMDTIDPSNGVSKKTFPVNFAKILRIVFLQNTFGRLHYKYSKSLDSCIRTALYIVDAQYIFLMLGVFCSLVT